MNEIKIKCRCDKEIIFKSYTGSPKDIIICDCGNEYIPFYKGGTDKPCIFSTEKECWIIYKE
jgi:hypothetical protein